MFDVGDSSAVSHNTTTHNTYGVLNAVEIEVSWSSWKAALDVIRKNAWSPEMSKRAASNSAEPFWTKTGEAHLGIVLEQQKRTAKTYIIKLGQLLNKPKQVSYFNQTMIVSLRSNKYEAELCFLLLVVSLRQKTALAGTKPTV